MKNWEDLLTKDELKHIRQDLLMVGERMTSHTVKIALISWLEEQKSNRWSCSGCSSIAKKLNITI